MRLLVLFVVLLVLFGCKKSKENTLPEAERIPYREYRTERWYKAYALNQLDSAQVLIEKRLAAFPHEIPTLPSYAEVLIRRQMLDSALTIVDSVLTIDPGNGYGYKLKGDIYYLKRFRDSTITVEEYAQHYRKATEVEPEYGKAWEMLFTVSEERGDTALSKQCLRQLSQRNFYTKTTLRRIELVLAKLPKDAILITNGDLEYFPARLLQSVLGFRRDVVVLNSALLNSRFHFEYARRKGLFASVTEEEFKTYRTFKFGREFKGRSFALINKLLYTFDKGELKRPICFITLPTQTFMQPVMPRLKYRGFTREIQAKGSAFDMNADSLAHFFRSLNPEDFSEPAVGAQETSPVLLASRYIRNIDFHLIMPGILAVDNYMQQGRIPEAKAMIQDMKMFLDAVKSNSEQSKKMVKAYESRVIRTESGEKVVQ